ncbi:hypothetical protein R3W88_014291 [Solanum pinnatisectum]|uniref:Uncharacterized protein n=1 Tax=Solanum pinnatisectum TaxID=50273 RepID=A0AAV9KS02_9SOLN|nr:hypothetical protein R3W88_014291 [Solanum pinnatisectum]
MVLQNQLGHHQAFSHEHNHYSAESNHGQMMRPFTMPFSQSAHNNHMMVSQQNGGYYGSHGHGHSHGHSNYGSHGHMPHDSTNFSSSTSMVHNDGGYGSGMNQSSHANMSFMSMGHHGGHGHGHGHGLGYGGSHQNSYSQSQKVNWALKNLDD